MSGWVVDASVIAAAFFRERHAGPSVKVLSSKAELQAPDLVIAEVGNVIWKRHRRGEIDADEARELLADVVSLPLRLAAVEDLAEPALRLALETGRTMYDSLYLALAVQAKSVMVTADERLLNALADTPLREHVKWIAEVV